ncbi:two-partner secretion domain-containing protein [Avibacterium sp. 21-599]|uniref:two-partner secretion domain-containing protein n=1 Tax=Avibacterium sp. 21-599 TaxID=2911528 RepID=UPI002245CF57|nr:filamentous hemagglutinin N-terminal domain-containing protein [Avibacterium sp. 21-599]MCW9717402.1 filamentous hemagglutinin N-terminal domain-containing protein [Avibacterium sp. 21-599]
MKYSLSLITLAVLSNSALANSIEENALPKNHHITQGSAEISSNGNAMNINQHSDRVSIDWESFNIGKQASVTFKQPNSSSIAYNRVTGADISTIQGKLNANGRVFLSNPNGIIFTKDAQVNVGALLATTKEIEKLTEKPTRSYSRDELRFKRKKQQEGEIRNDGIVQAQEAIYLVGDKVKNNGKLEVIGKPEEVIQLSYSGKIDGINVKNKTVFLAASDNFDFDLSNFSISLTGKDVAGLIENNGAIISNDRIVLTAKGEEQLKHAAVNNNGLLEANNITIEGGKIVLTEQSDIRYGKTQHNGAALTITQIGKDKDAGVKISGKITALAKTDKVKESVYANNDRFKVGKLVLDEDGKVLYTTDKKTILKAESTPEGLKAEDSKVYVYRKDGVLTINAIDGGYVVASDGWKPESNSKIDALRLPYSTSKIMTISYKEKNGVFSELEITQNKTGLDPINQQIIDTLKEKVANGDYSFLENKNLNSLVESIIDEQRQALIQRLGISNDQLSLLSNEQHVTINGNEYKTNSYLLKENVDKVFEKLQEKNAEVKREDITLLASLLNNRRQATIAEDIYRSKSGYINDEKQEIYPLVVSQTLSDKLKQDIKLPLTTISAEAPITITNATFDHTQNGQHNMMLLANNRTTPLDIHLNNVNINLGQGSFGIGSQFKPESLKEDTLIMKEVDGKLLQLYSLTGNPSLQQKTLKELLQDIKFYDYDLELTTKNNQKISAPELWKQFVANAESLENKNLDQQNFYQFIQTEFNEYANKHLATVLPQLNILLRRSTFSNGSSINSSWTKVVKAKQTNEIAGLSATQKTPFNVSLNHVTFNQTKDFIIADGFKSVLFDHVKTNDEFGLYINAGNQRVYAAKETNLSEKVKKKGYEYLISDLEERVMRGNFSVHNERYGSNSDQALKLAKRELSTGFEDWDASLWNERSHIDGTTITIRNSQLNSHDGFMHLLAEKVDIHNSHLAVDFSRQITDSFMPKASKIAINGKHILLDNSQLFVNGADKLHISPEPQAASLFIIGNLIGRNSEIYAKNHQYYTFRTSGRTTLSGEHSPEDLRITLIHTGSYPKDNGSVFGPNPADYLVDNIAFNVGDVMQSDEQGNVVSSARTTLKNLKFNIFAPNGARAFESFDISSKSYLPNINVTDTANFTYFEQPRVIAKSANVVSGKSNAVSLRDMLRIIDRIQGIQASDLAGQQTSNLDNLSSLDLAEKIWEKQTMSEDNTDVEICEGEEGKKTCKTLNSSSHAEVSVGDIL